MVGALNYERIFDYTMKCGLLPDSKEVPMKSSVLAIRKIHPETVCGHPQLGGEANEEAETITQARFSRA